jgi:hypothetical protein
LIEIDFLYYILVNLKRSKSAPGLVEASCRLPFHAPVRRAGSNIHRLSSVKEADILTLAPSTLPLNPSFSKQHHLSTTSSNSFLTAAPLASSISVTSSLNSARQQTINHSLSWSATADTKKADTIHVGRTVSLMNNNIRNRNNTILTDEIEHLKRRLIELEKEDLTLNSVYQQEYIELKNRLKILEEKLLSDGR